MRSQLSKNAAYFGAGSGLVIFSLFGMLPGSFLGGAAGIKIAGIFFGLPLAPAIISRAIILSSMLVGVVVAGIVIVTATSAAGWLLGRILEAGMPESAGEHIGAHNR